MQNPFKDLREKAHLSQREFAAAFGLPIQSVVSCEHCSQENPPKRLLQALSASGVDVEPMIQQYHEYRLFQGRAAMARLAEAL